MASSHNRSAAAAATAASHSAALLGRPAKTQRQHRAHVGGFGGGGGAAGAVNVTNVGSVTTYGDQANGVAAQSIGGGGGNGGSAVTGLLAGGDATQGRAIKLPSRSGASVEMAIRRRRRHRQSNWRRHRDLWRGRQWHTRPVHRRRRRQRRRREHDLAATRHVLHLQLGEQGHHGLQGAGESERQCAGQRWRLRRDRQRRRRGHSQQPGFHHHRRNLVGWHHGAVDRRRRRQRRPGDSRPQRPVPTRHM